MNRSSRRAVRGGQGDRERLQSRSRSPTSTRRCKPPRPGRAARSSRYARWSLSPCDSTTVNAELARVVREHASRLAASLVRVTGDFASAEDLVQDAVLAALRHWPVDGIPDRPDAWLFTRRPAPGPRPLSARDTTTGPSWRSCSRRSSRRAGRAAAADLHLLPPGAARDRPRSR